MSTLAQIAREDFAASAELAESNIRVSFSGNADHVVLGDLEDFVPKVHAEARRARVSEVCVDMANLEFMNSSCFRTLVNWVGWIRRLPPEDQYFLRFAAAPSRHWQRPSLQALACFATHIVRLENLS
jgi:hypothetical protein